MGNLRNRLLSGGIIALLVIVSLLPVVPLAAATNDPPNSGGIEHVTGDWTVVDTRTYDSQTEIYMDNGNVVVKDGGILTLNLAGLNFMSTIHGQYGLTVEKGGKLVMAGGAYIASGNTRTWYCGFMPGSTIDLDDSFISRMGGAAPNAPNTGIYIGTDNATIDGMFFADNVAWTDIMTVQAENVSIRNSTFAVEMNDGIEVDGSVVLHDNEIYAVGPWTNSGVEVRDESEVEMIGNEIHDMWDGVMVMNDGYAYLEGNYLHNNSGTGFWAYNAEGLLVNNEIVDNGEAGVSAMFFGKVTLREKNWIHYNEDGLRIQMNSLLNSTGSIIENNADNNIEVMKSELILKGDQLGPSGNTNIEANILSDVTIVGVDIDGGGAWNSLIQVYFNSHLELRGSDLHDADNMVYVGDESDAVLIGNTFSDVGWTAVMAESFAYVLSRGNTFTDVGQMFGAWYGEIDSFNDVGSNPVMTDTVAMACWENSEIRAHNLDFQATGANSMGVYADSDTMVTVVDSSFDVGGPEQLSVFGGGVITSINSTPTLADSAVYGEGQIHIGWHGEVLTQWQNGVPAPDAQVRFNDTNGKIIDKVRTDENGTAFLPIIQATLLADGAVKHNVYNVSAELNGMKGNVSADVKDNVVGDERIVVTIMDDGMPDINITYPAHEWMTNDGLFVMNGTASDVGSGLEVVLINDTTGWYTATGLEDWEFELNLTEGDYILEAKVVDISGNEVIDSINITVDMTPPEIVINEPAGTYVLTNEFDLVGNTEMDALLTVDGEDVTLDADGNFSVAFNLTDGEHVIILVATDLVGNIMTVDRTVIVDTIPPALASDIADGDYVKEKALALTGTTDGITVTVNGENATLDEVNGTWSIDLTLEEGANNVSIEAKDLAGHTTTIDQIINVDTIPPELTVTSPSGEGPFNTNEVNITVAGTVTGADVLTLNEDSVTVDAAGNFSLVNYTLAEGENTLVLVAKDLAGNEATVTLTVILDTKAPELEITSPEDGLVTNSATVTGTGTVDDLDATLKYGATNLTNVNGTFSFTASLSVGQNTLEVTATDLAGNTATIGIDVTYDNSVVMLVESPKKEKVTTTEDTISITGTSESGAVVTVNGVTVSDAGGNFDYEMVLKEGKNTVTVTVIDQAGNTETQVFTVTKEDTSTGTMDLATTLGIGVLLLIIGLVVGLLIGRMAGKPKEQPSDRYYPKPEDEEEEPTTGPEPEEESPFKAEDEEPEPRDEEIPDKEPEAKPEAKPEDDGKGSLEDLLKDLDKKK